MWDGMMQAHNQGSVAVLLLMGILIDREDIQRYSGICASCTQETK
jgi:hypothetical protein